MSLFNDIKNPVTKRGRRKSKFYDSGKHGHLNLLALRISRYWNQEPKWFQNLDRETQTELIAEYILTHETNDARKKRREQHQRATAEKWRKKSM